MQAASAPDASFEGTVAVLTGSVPDAWGRLHVDVKIAEGSYAYLGLLELEVE